jgi:hypothetical protein
LNELEVYKIGFTQCAASVTLLYDHIEYNPAGQTNDLHRFDTTTLTWTDFSKSDTGERPSPRVSHGQVSDGSGNYIYVFGGWSGGKYLLNSIFF